MLQGRRKVDGQTEVNECMDGWISLRMQMKVNWSGSAKGHREKGQIQRPHIKATVAERQMRGAKSSPPSLCPLNIYTDESKQPSASFWQYDLISMAKYPASHTHIIQSSIRHTHNPNINLNTYKFMLLQLASMQNP